MGHLKFLSLTIIFSAVSLYTIGLRGSNSPGETPTKYIISIGASTEFPESVPVQGPHNWGTAHKVFSQPYPSSGFFVASPSVIPSTEHSERALFLNLSHMDYLPWWSLPPNSIGVVRIKDTNNGRRPKLDSIKFIQLISGQEINRALTIEYIGPDTIEIRYYLFETSLAGPLYFFIGWDKETIKTSKTVKKIP